MSRFIETIRIREGQAMHLDWHQRRVDATLRFFYSTSTGTPPTLVLKEILDAHPFPSTDLLRCRITYDRYGFLVEYFHYQIQTIRTLRLTDVPAALDYKYKYADRHLLEQLYASRGEADDILMTREGWITDTFNANIAFRKGDRWYTPSFPLLAGTTWKRLISEGRLIPRPIQQSELSVFETFRVFNAMRDWDDVCEEAISGRSLVW